MMKSTRRWRRYWQERKIDWNQAYGSSPEATDHPHRRLIVDIVKSLPVTSLMEVGCGAGVNLVRLKRDIPHLQVGGCDISEEAIETAKKLLPQSVNILDARDATDLFFSDKSVDCALMDMCGIYLNRKEIRKALKEIKRVTRKCVLFIEFHHPSLLKRLALKFGTGYNSYRWDKLLEEMDYHDISVQKLPDWAWPGGQPQETYGYVIFART